MIEHNGVFFAQYLLSLAADSWLMKPSAAETACCQEVLSQPGRHEQ